jgi:histidine ammonia-lyase
LRVIAIELLCGAQRLKFRERLHRGRGVAAARDFIRASVPRRLEADRPRSADIERVGEMVRNGSLASHGEEAVGSLEPTYAG